MSEVINGYPLTTPFTTANSGFGRWAFANKDRQDFFIKELLKPAYPVDASLLMPEQYERKLRLCQEFEKKKSDFIAALNQCANGNIVTITDFFRWNAKYYIVTEKIDVASVSMEQIAAMDIQKKIIIARVIADCVKRLHDNGIVHGDLKPDNILIKRTKSGYHTAKLIDFDESFFECDPPCGEELHGDLVYFAPESILYIGGRKGESVTSKIDVFALGILLHQYFTGQLPPLGGDHYAFEAILNRGKVAVSDALPECIAELIRDMLSAEPTQRPDLEQVLNRLSDRSAPAQHELEPREADAPENAEDIWFIPTDL